MLKLATKGLKKDCIELTIYKMALPGLLPVCNSCIVVLRQSPLQRTRPEIELDLKFILDYNTDFKKYLLLNDFSPTSRIGGKNEKYQSL